MKVLHVVASLAPAHGGPTEAALGMVRSLQRRGVEASILSSNDDRGGILPVPTGRWVTHAGARVWFIPRIPSRQHSLAGFTLAPGFIPWLRRYLREYDFIHVHTVFSFPANCAMGMARRRTIPYAARPLGQLCDWSLRQNPAIKKAMLSLVTRRNLNKAAFIHCTTAMEAEETGRLHLRSPLLVLPHGLDVPPVIARAREELREKLAVPPDRPLVIFLSRLHEKKGVDILVEACGRLREMPFDLVLAGSGADDYVKRLRARIADAGLANRAHWTGFVSGDDKWRLLQGGDLFVLPSHSENFGIAVLEALACGLPAVVSTNVALHSEVAAHGLGRAIPLDAGRLAHAIRELLEDPHERNRIRSVAPDWVARHFGWDSAADRLIAAYESAIRSGSAATRAPS